MSDWISEREWSFLDRVMRNQPLALADRKEDRARQRMRRLGFVEVLKNPRRWAITPEGFKVLTSGSALSKANGDKDE